MMAIFPGRPPERRARPTAWATSMELDLGSTNATPSNAGMSTPSPKTRAFATISTRSPGSRRRSTMSRRARAGVFPLIQSAWTGRSGSLSSASMRRAASMVLANQRAPQTAMI